MLKHQWIYPEMLNVWSTYLHWPSQLRKCRYIDHALSIWDNESWQITSPLDDCFLGKSLKGPHHFKSSTSQQWPKAKHKFWWIGYWFDKQGEISEVWGDFGCICFGCFGCNPCSMFILEDFLCFQKSPPRPHQWVVFFLRNKKHAGSGRFFQVSAAQPSAGGSENPNPSTKCVALVVNQSDEWQWVKTHPQTVLAKEIRSCFFAHNLPWSDKLHQSIRIRTKPTSIIECHKSLGHCSIENPLMSHVNQKNNRNQLSHRKKKPLTFHWILVV